MKKMLFISNVPKKITNFAIPSIEAAQKLGYEVHMAANFSCFSDNNTTYNVVLHQIDLVRNPFSFRNIKAYFQMLRLIREEGFDFIHCNTPVGGLLGRLCGKRARVRKIIYTAHGFHFYKGAPLVNWIVYYLAERFLARFTDALITMNSEDFETAKRLRLRKGGKAYFIPGVGTNIGDFVQIDSDSDKNKLKKSLGLPENSFVLIAMGDLIKRKNYESSVKAIEKAKNENLHLLICGTGSEKDKLIDLSEKLKVENKIHFLGFRSDIKELLSISDAFLFTTYQEGLPRSMMEAMAAGVPCIASQIRGNVDLINNGEGGFLCPPDDVNGFARAINKLAADNSLRIKMGMNNLESIKKYDVENVKRLMIEIYAEVQLESVPLSVLVV